MKSILSELPTGLYDARDISLKREAAETQPTETELAQECARAAAHTAAIVAAHCELGNSLLFYDKTFLRHSILIRRQTYHVPRLRNGIPISRNNSTPSSSVRALVQIVMFIPRILSTLS